MDKSNNKILNKKKEKLISNVNSNIYKKISENKLNLLNGDLYWDSNISEYEVDPSWKKHKIYKSKEYLDYRDKWKKQPQLKVVLKNLRIAS